MPAPEATFVPCRAVSRGPEEADLHLVPTLWFRNTWSGRPGVLRPILRRIDLEGRARGLRAAHPELGERWLYAHGEPELLFTENDSNAERLWGAKTTHLWKDGFHVRVVTGREDAVSALHHGTKACFWSRADVAPGGVASFDYRL